MHMILMPLALVLGGATTGSDGSPGPEQMELDRRARRAILLTPEGGVAFRVESWSVDVGPTGTMTFVFHNLSRHWAEPEISPGGLDASSPGRRLQDGEDWTVTESLERYRDRTTHIRRWRPGFLGLPTDSEGNLKVEIPRDARSARVEITIVN